MPKGNDLTVVAISCRAFVPISLMAESTIQQRVAASPDIGPINITSREFKAHSDEYYARLRQETPVVRTTLPDKQTAWLVTRYDDVAMVLKDDRFSKSFSGHVRCES